MSTAPRHEVSSCRIAYVNDLFSIQPCELALKGCGSLSFLARTWLAYFIALVRLDYNQIKAPVGALAHAQWLAVAGYSRSRSSAFRALKELEQAGFIHRHKLRVGRDCRGLVIDLNHDRFTYWTQERKLNVLPLRTMSQVSPCVSTRHPDYVTNNSHMLHTTKSDDLSFNSSRSNKHTKPENQETLFDSWSDPRLYTIGIVLKQTAPPDRKFIYKRARAVLGGLIECPALDLAHWTPDQWWTMTHAEREHYALTTLLPAIRGANAMPKPDKRVVEVVKQLAEACDRPKELDEAVYKLIREVEPDEPSEVVSTLDDEDLAVLKAANNRAQHRRERYQDTKRAEHAEHKEQLEKQS